MTEHTSDVVVIGAGLIGLALPGGWPQTRCR